MLNYWFPDLAHSIAVLLCIIKEEHGGKIDWLSPVNGFWLLNLSPDQMRLDGKHFNQFSPAFFPVIDKIQKKNHHTVILPAIAPGYWCNITSKWIRYIEIGVLWNHRRNMSTSTLMESLGAVNSQLLSLWIFDFHNFHVFP